MSLFATKTRHVNALLRVTFERERDCNGHEPCDVDLATGGHDGKHMHDGGLYLASIERVDGLVDLQRCRGHGDDVWSFKENRFISSAGPFDPEKNHAEGGELWWAQTFQDNVGADMLNTADVDLDTVDRIVVTGRMHTSVYHGPEGGDYEEDFEVETIEACEGWIYP